MTRGFRNFVLCTCMCGCTTLAALAQEVPLPEAVTVNAQKPEEVLFWDRMTAEQRARLWPLLTHEQRLFQWRYMTKDERRQMRQHMTPTERRAIKLRYVVDGHAINAKEVRPVRKMTPAERELLRQQVIQVHVEIRRGVPYSCTDPTDCPRTAYRSRVAERAMKAEAAAAASAAPVAVQAPSSTTVIIVPSANPPTP